MDKPTKRTPGRPEGQLYPHSKSLKLRDVDMERLRGLAAKLDRDQSAVLRYALEVLAKREGLK